MKTTDLAPAAQLYLAFFWEGGRLVKKDGYLHITAQHTVLRLYKPGVKALKPELMELLSKAEAVRGERKDAFAKAHECFLNAASDPLKKPAAFTTAVELFRLNTLPKSPRNGPCDHCGEGKGPGRDQIREHGVFPYVRLHPRCREEWTLVHTAISTAALAELQDMAGLPVNTEASIETRLGALKELELEQELESYEFGLARRTILTAFGLVRSSRSEATTEPFMADYQTAAYLLQKKRKLPSDVASNTASRAFGNAQVAANADEYARVL